MLEWLIVALTLPCIFTWVAIELWRGDWIENHYIRSIKKYARGPYEEYVTASLIDDGWFDMSTVGRCDVCRCEDAPIVWVLNICKCKWCAELDNLEYHLRTNGVRRFKKEIDG